MPLSSLLAPIISSIATAMLTSSGKGGEYSSPEQERYYRAQADIAELIRNVMGSRIQTEQQMLPQLLGTINDYTMGKLNTPRATVFGGDTSFKPIFRTGQVTTPAKGIDVSQIPTTIETPAAAPPPDYFKGIEEVLKKLEEIPALIPQPPAGGAMPGLLDLTNAIGDAISQLTLGMDRIGQDQTKLFDLLNSLNRMDAGGGLDGTVGAVDIPKEGDDMLGVKPPVFDLEGWKGIQDLVGVRTPPAEGDQGRPPVDLGDTLGGNAARGLVPDMSKITDLVGSLIGNLPGALEGAVGAAVQQPRFRGSEVTPPAPTSPPLDIASLMQGSLGRGGAPPTTTPPIDLTSLIGQATKSITGALGNAPATLSDTLGSALKPSTPASPPMDIASLMAGMIGNKPSAPVSSPMDIASLMQGTLGRGGAPPTTTPPIDLTSLIGQATKSITGALGSAPATLSDTLGSALKPSTPASPPMDIASLMSGMIGSKPSAPTSPPLDIAGLMSGMIGNKPSAEKGPAPFTRSLADLARSGALGDAVKGLSTTPAAPATPPAPVDLTASGGTLGGNMGARSVSTTTLGIPANFVARGYWDGNKVDYDGAIAYVQKIAKQQGITLTAAQARSLVDGGSVQV